MSKSTPELVPLIGVSAQQHTLIQNGQPSVTAQTPKPRKPRIVLEPGFVLGGYQILKKLGSGGMGEVHIGWDEQLQRKVALKVLRPEHQTNSETQERFVREARAVAAITHDNVVPVYQVGVQDDLTFMVMPLLRGATLETFLERKGLPLPQQALRIARDILRGLAAAHARGLIHRDIKPANIWLESPNGRVKILDFGIAKPTAAAVIGPDREITHNGTLMGTPNYMSPEQARGHFIDARSDLFSVGALLYRLTTGRLPFQRDTIMDTLAAVAAEPPTAPRELNAAISLRFEQFILKLLAKRPGERYANCEAALHDVRILERELAVESPDFVGTLALPPLHLSGAIETPSIYREPTEWGFEVVEDSRRSASAIPVVAKQSYLTTVPPDELTARSKRMVTIMAVVVLVCAVCVIALGIAVTKKARTLQTAAPVSSSR